MRSVIMFALGLLLTSCGATTTAGQTLVGQTPSLQGRRLLDEAELSLAALRGKVVLVDFWASWCAPCRTSFPYYDGLRDRLGPSGFEVVGVSVDEERALAARFATDLGARFPIVWDEGQRLARRWAVTAMPTAVLLDREGVVRYVHGGFEADAPAVIEAQVRALLGPADLGDPGEPLEL